ncbi:hypothetical protein [Nocardia abscessus]|uniref:hypothetical protein n=1 Tax=Nocardia abscessus TaxID=120957 RepID=UPI00313C598F
MSSQFRLDDLIEGIKKARPDNVLEQLSDAVVVANHLDAIGAHNLSPIVDHGPAARKCRGKRGAPGEGRQVDPGDRE